MSLEAMVYFSKLRDIIFTKAAIVIFIAAKTSNFLSLLAVVVTR